MAMESNETKCKIKKNIRQVTRSRGFLDEFSTLVIGMMILLLNLRMSFVKRTDIRGSRE